MHDLFSAKHTQTAQKSTNTQVEALNSHTHREVLKFRFYSLFVFNHEGISESSYHSEGNS